MRFTHEGTEYLIEFERTQRLRPEHAQVHNEKAPINRQTLTTAKILKVVGTGKGPEDVQVVRQWTVGHHYRDRYDPEVGRKYALTLAMYDAPTKGAGTGVGIVGIPLTKEFRTAVWHAYHNREGVFQPGKRRG